ncbi:MAG: hypothetical protein CMQ42_03275 [Gammaproteobacteria bacterium]|nr:hypothetical protein [Gammaproteobacteria bacterium]
MKEQSLPTLYAISTYLDNFLTGQSIRTGFTCSTFDILVARILRINKKDMPMEVFVRFRTVALIFFQQANRCCLFFV